MNVKSNLDRYCKAVMDKTIAITLKGEQLVSSLVFMTYIDEPLNGLSVIGKLMVCLSF